MTHDISDFERQLGRELRAAGHRRLQARSSNFWIRRWRPVALTAAVAAATLVAVLALAGLRPPAATAHPFKVVHLEDGIRLDVIDVVEDPRSAEQELQDELGVDVEFVARPAPPELVDQVVSVSSTGTTSARPVFGDDGRAERFVLPREIDGRLSIQYGRPAQPGEDYHVTITSPACHELWAQAPRQAAARLAELSDNIRYNTVDSDYKHESDVALDDIDPGYRLVDIMFLSQDELLVVYAAHLDALGANRPQCGWSSDPPG
jgi:hypothetical protein